MNRTSAFGLGLVTFSLFAWGVLGGDERDRLEAPVPPPSTELVVRLHTAACPADPFDQFEKGRLIIKELARLVRESHDANDFVRWSAAAKQFGCTALMPGQHVYMDGKWVWGLAGFGDAAVTARVPGALVDVWVSAADLCKPTTPGWCAPWSP